MQREVSRAGVCQHLDPAVRDMLSKRHSSILLLGEGGSGKSTFLWQLGKSLTEGHRDLLSTPLYLARSPFPVVVPVFLDLRKYSVSDIGSQDGLLRRTLLKVGLSVGEIEALRTQDPREPRVRLVLLADGMDELRGNVASIQDFVGAISGGVPWHPHLLTVLATCRLGKLENQATALSVDTKLVFLLPLSQNQVRRCVVALVSLLVCRM